MERFELRTRQTAGTFRGHEKGSEPRGLCDRGLRSCGNRRHRGAERDSYDRTPPGAGRINRRHGLSGDLSGVAAVNTDLA